MTTPPSPPDDGDVGDTRVDDGGVDAGADGGDAPATCRHCGRSFPSTRTLVLHRGVRHPEALSADERAAYRDAYADEEAQLRSFRLRALAVLVLLYFGFLFVYASVAT